jgi:hypothetical protein
VFRSGAESQECIPDGCFDPYAATAEPESCNHFGDDFVIRMTQLGPGVSKDGMPGEGV